MNESNGSFVFFTRLHLTELTGIKASNLEELLYYLKKIPGSSIYHHTHRFLQQHQYLSPEPPNDFAYWVNEVIGEEELAEGLSGINTVEYRSIHSLRSALVKKTASYIRSHKNAGKKTAKPGQEFFFMKSISFVFQTRFSASNLKELAGCLEKITVDSLYFHIFEARLRLEESSNDIANWVRNTLGQRKLADELSRLDPYTFTMNRLRKEMIRLILKHEGEQNARD